jgi:hypothetical protein
MREKERSKSAQEGKKEEREEKEEEFRIPDYDQEPPTEHVK